MHELSLFDVIKVFLALSNGLGDQFMFGLDEILPFTCQTCSLTVKGMARNAIATGFAILGNLGLLGDAARLCPAGPARFALLAVAVIVASNISGTEFIS
jgi:hypothetical protein